MRVVFFQPRTVAQKNYKNIDGSEQVWAPWFAMLLSPVAKEYGYDVELIDARTADDWEKRVGELNARDVFCVTAMTGKALIDALSASKIAKSCGAFVVWGGVHPTLFPEQTLNSELVDAVVRGFGYSGLRSCLSQIRESSFRPGDGAQVFNNDDVGAPIPSPDTGLVPSWGDYINVDSAIAGRTINFVTSEGCPCFCTFCSEPVTSRRHWLPHDLEVSVTVLDELVSKSSANGIKLHDPNFFFDVRRAKIFADLSWERFQVKWAASIHPATLASLSVDELTHFSKKGLSRVLVGVESPIPEVIKLSGKQYDPSMIPALAGKLAAAGIRGMFTYIVGWPGRPSEDCDRAIESSFAVRDIWEEHQAKIHFLEPWPGTPISRYAQRFGIDYPETIEEMANIDYYLQRFKWVDDESVNRVREANSQLSPYVQA